jgi:hypothetical protein
MSLIASRFAQEAAIRSIQFGGVAEGPLVVLQRRNHMLLVDGIPVDHLILRDQALRAFGKEYLVAELDRRLRVSLAPIEALCRNRDRASRVLVGAKDGRREGAELMAKMARGRSQERKRLAGGQAGNRPTVKLG